MGPVSLSVPPLMQEGINEIIASCRNNAAPMGIICRNGTLMMAVFRTSHTASLVEEEGRFVANILYDPVVYVRTAFGDPDPDEFITWMVDGHLVFRLRSALSWVVYEAEVKEKTAMKILFSLTPVETVSFDIPAFPVNRGFNSVIEAAVHGTRYIHSRDLRLKLLIDHHADLIRRCGGEREREALRLLLAYIA